MAELSVLQPCNEQKQAFGTDITLKYAKGNLISLLVNGNENQITTRQSKNQLDKNGLTVNDPTYTNLISIDSTGFTAGQIAGHHDFVGEYRDTIPGQQYTLSFSVTGTSSPQAYVYSDHPFSTLISAQGSPLTFTATTTQTYIGFYVNGDTTVWTNLQLEPGTAATSYVSFVPESPSFRYPSIDHEVTKVTVNGIDYALSSGLLDNCHFDLISGQGMASRNKEVINNDSTITVDAVGTLYVSFKVAAPNLNYSSSDMVLRSNHFIQIPYLDADGATAEGISYSRASAMGIISILKSRIPGWSDSWTADQMVSAFKSLMVANSVTVVYDYVTPQAITGTPQTIPATIPTTITNDNGGQMSVTYPAIFECLATTSRAFDDHTVHELMRMYTIQAAVANTDSVRRYITPGVSFESHGQMYDLTNFKKESGSNNVTSVSAQHVGYRLLNYSIQPGYSFVGTIAQIAADMLDMAVDDKGNKASSEFQIGTTPDLGTISFDLKNTDVVTAKYAIMALKDIGAESDFDNFTINFAQQIGGGQTQTFEFGVNMADVSITYDKSNGTTYEMGIADLQIKDPQDHPFDAGWYAHGIDRTTGEEFTKRIINYDKCWDDPTQDKITLGVFVSDVSTETAQMSIDIDHTVKQGEPYNNVSISHMKGFESTDATGDKIVRMGGTNGFELFVKQSDGTLKRVGYFDYNGLATANIVGTINGSEDTKASIGLYQYADGSIGKGLFLNTAECYGAFLILQTVKDAIGANKIDVAADGDLIIRSNVSSSPQEQANEITMSEDTDRQGTIRFDRASGQGNLAQLFYGDKSETAIFSPDGTIQLRLGKDGSGNDIVEFAFNGTYNGYVAADGYHGKIDGHTGFNGTLQTGEQTLQVLNGRILE